MGCFLRKIFFLERKTCGVCVSQVSFFRMGRALLNMVFFFNNELLDTNMKEASLTAERIIHDKIVSEGGRVSKFDISSDLEKNCMLASQRYRQDLKQQRKQKVNSEKSLKRKTECEELKNLNKTLNLLRKHH